MKQQDVENVGIMSGFGDDLDSLISEVMAEEGMTEGEEYETGKLMDRTPNSPEILMNNLRGDMRSMDARREELADMVGYNAAMETPDEVLALLQAQIAADQAPAGIGALPPAAPMPQGAPPMPQGGIAQMAKGGYVQNFAEGSDEDGVTPYGDTSSFGAFPPEIVDMAKQQTMLNLARTPSEVPDLQTAMDKRMPMYEELLGGDDDMTQAQALLALSQAAFDWAGGKSFGEAASGASGTLIKLAGQKQKEDRAIKLAALQAAEKDVENIRSSNAKLIDSQRKTWTAIAKGSGSGIFSKNSAEYNIINQPNLMSRYSLAQTTPTENNLIETAIAKLEYKAKPRIERYTDDRGFVVEREVAGTAIPKFVADAINSRSQILSGNVPDPITPETEDQITAKVEGLIPADQVMTADQEKQVVTQAGKATEDEGPKLGLLTSTQTKVAYPEWNRNATEPDMVDPRTHSYYRPDEKTVFNMAMTGDVTGPVASIAAGVERIPLVGPLLKDTDSSEARSFVTNTIKEVANGLRTNDRFNEGERTSIISDLDALPAFFDNKEAYIARNKAVDDVLSETFSNAKRTTQSTIASKKEIDTAREKMKDIHDIRRKLGIPIFMDNPNDPRIKELPAGTPFIYNNKWYKARGAQ